MDALLLWSGGLMIGLSIGVMIGQYIEMRERSNP